MKVEAATPEPVASMSSDLLDTVRNFFLDGNVVVRVGIVVLFFGVAFLLKYAADQGMLSIEWRLSAAALGALALIGAGWRLRHRRLTYALLIQGGGIGLFYLRRNNPNIPSVLILEPERVSGRLLAG